VCFPSTKHSSYASSYPSLLSFSLLHRPWVGDCKSVPNHSLIVFLVQFVFIFSVLISNTNYISLLFDTFFAFNSFGDYDGEATNLRWRNSRVCNEEILEFDLKDCRFAMKRRIKIKDKWLQLKRGISIRMKIKNKNYCYWIS
jgi:hypothetical protein